MSINDNKNLVNKNDRHPRGKVPVRCKWVISERGLIGFQFHHNIVTLSSSPKTTKYCLFPSCQDWYEGINPVVDGNFSWGSRHDHQVILTL